MRCSHNALDKTSNHKIFSSPPFTLPSYSSLFFFKSIPQSGNDGGRLRAPKPKFLHVFDCIQQPIKFSRSSEKEWAECVRMCVCSITRRPLWIQFYVETKKSNYETYNVKLGHHGWDTYCCSTVAVYVWVYLCACILCGILLSTQWTRIETCSFFFPDNLREIVLFRAIVVKLDMWTEKRRRKGKPGGD